MYRVQMFLRTQTFQYLGYLGTITLAPTKKKEQANKHFACQI